MTPTSPQPKEYIISKLAFDEAIAHLKAGKMFDIAELLWSECSPYHGEPRSRPPSPQLFHQPGSKIEYTVEQIAEIDKLVKAHDPHITAAPQKRYIILDLTKQQIKEGDVIQCGYFILGNDSIQWGSHQVVRWITSEGIPVVRPRDAKEDKYKEIWRFPIEDTESIIKDLKMYANPMEAKKAIESLRGKEQPK